MTALSQRIAARKLGIPPQTLVCGDRGCVLPAHDQETFHRDAAGRTFAERDPYQAPWLREVRFARDMTGRLA